MAAVGGGVGRPLSGCVTLSPAHDVAGFACGVAAFDDWLRTRTPKNESRFLRTYVVCHGETVVAYVSVAAGSVERAAAPGRIRRNAPDVIPVSIIARLAVDRSCTGRGLGADLLSDALRRIATVSREIAIAAVLVQAKDEAAKRFYLRCAEFIEYPDDSRMLFLPIETVIAATSA